MRNQSFIATLRDQLSLDYASGTHLNVISSNLGMFRPSFGFTDDEWRAVVREIALQEKQVATKFGALIATIYGPQNPVGTTLREDASPGELVLKVHSTDGIPQIGTLTIDSVLSSTEQVEYRFVNRITNEIHLVTPLSTTHYASIKPTSASVLAYDRIRNKVVLTSSYDFPTSGFPAPCVLGAEPVLVNGNNTTAGTVTLSIPPTDVTRDAPEATPTRVTLERPYLGSSGVLLSVEDRHLFSTGDLVLFGNENTTQGVATGGTIATISVATAVVEDLLVGSVVVFTGNITSSLAGVSRVVSGNGATTIDLHDYLSTSPAVGDTFRLYSIRTVVGFESDDISLVLDRPVYGLEYTTAGSFCEIVRPVEKLFSAQVLVEGKGWSVHQSEPGYVDLLLPSTVTGGSLRSASYLHRSGGSFIVDTTLTAAVAPGDNTLTVASTSGLPLVGVLYIGSENHGFFVESPTMLVLPTTSVVGTYPIATTVGLLEYRYGGGDLVRGDHHTYPGSFPGPYLFSPTSQAQAGLSSSVASLSKAIPSKTTIAMSSEVGSAALEVFSTEGWDLASLPLSISVGLDSNNVETTQVLSVSKKYAVRASLSAAASSGSTTIDVTNVGSGLGSTFPTVDGFRLVLGSIASQEVVWVESNTFPTLTLRSPLVNSYLIGAEVRLAADVLTVDPLGDEHVGAAAISQRDTSESGVTSVPSSSETSEAVGVLTSSITVDQPTAIPDSAGKVVINGTNPSTTLKYVSLAALTAGDTTITTAFNDLPDADFTVTLSPGFHKEEKVHVLTNTFNTLLTLANPLKNSHPIDSVVEFKRGPSSVVEFESSSGGVLQLPLPVVLPYHQQPGEYVAVAVDSTPTDDGYNFPLRLPSSDESRLRFLIDLIRAAGITVRFIDRL